MANYIRLPNGAFYEAPEGADYSDAIRKAYQDYPEAFGQAPAPKQDKSGFFPALTSGFRSGAGETATGLGELTGIQALTKFGKEQQEKAAQTYTPTTSEDIDAAQGILPTAGKYLSKYITEPVGEAAGSITGAFGLPMAAAAAAPEALGVGAIGAGALAFAATDAPIEIGKILAYQKEKGQETDPVAAVAAGLATAAVNSFSGQILAGPMRSIIGKTAMETAKELAPKVVTGELTAAEAATKVSGTVKNVLQGTAQNAVVGTGMMTADEALKRAGAGEDVTSPEAIKAYGEQAKTAVALSPFFGLMHGIGAKGAAERTIGEAGEARTKATADEIEAARTTPDALLALDTQYSTLKQQMDDIQAAIPEKPGKKSSKEDKQAFRDAKVAANQALEEFKTANPEYQSVFAEYNKRKDAIDALKAQQASEAPPAPPAPPNLQRLMEAHDALQRQDDQLAAKMTPESYDQLRPQQKDLHAQMATLSQQIESLGGTTVKPGEFEAQSKATLNSLDEQIKKQNEQIEKQKAALTTAIDPNNRDYEAADKINAKLKELAAERDKAIAERDKAAADIEMRRKALTEKQANLTERGQTRSLFTEEEAPIPKAQTEDVTPVKIPGMAEKPDEAVSAPVTAKMEAKQVSNVEPTAEEKATEASKKAYDLGEQLREAQSSLAPMQKMAASSRDQSAYISAVAKVADLKKQLADLQNVKPERIDTKSLDLFGEENVIRTALRNGDQRTIDRIQAEKEKIKLGQLDEEKAKRDALTKALDERLDLTGKKVTRNVTPEEYDRIMADIETEKRKVELPQRNAKKSLLQEIHDLADEHAALTSQMEKGVAAPTMREKVAGVQAKLGKGEAPAERPMNAGEKYQLQRKIDAVVNKYNTKLGQIKPIREKIEAMYKSMYKVEEAKAASVVEGEKRTVENLRALSVRGKSKQAATASRINRGDVRKEAEASEKMRSLAAELGREDPRYTQLVKEVQRRIKAQTEKYGKGDPASIAYQNDAFKMLQEKALQFGKETPEYKATLKEQIAYFQETLGAGVQEVKSKRGVQETRKVNRAPRENRTGSPESREATAIRQENESNRQANLRQYQLDMEEARRFDEQAREARGVEIESPDLTKTQVTALEENNVQAALADLANDTKADPVNRAVASRLAEVLDETDVALHNKLTNDKGVEILGQATSRVLDLNRSGGLSQEILLHEGTHSAAERVIQVFEKNPELLTEQQRAAVRELKAIFEVVKKDKTITSVNAKSSLSEFVAEVMSNINLQKQLKEKPWKLKEMWTGFKSAILRMLGLKVGDVNDMLRASLMSVDAIFTPTSMEIKGAERPAKGEAKGERKQLSQKDIAALHDGSNSMKQFSDQFGDFIKQKDRTPEDVERIASGYLEHMGNDPTAYIEVPYTPNEIFKKYDKNPESLTKEQQELVEKYKALDAENSADAAIELEKLKLKLTSLDYTSPTIMSDGKVYDENNPLHYVEANVDTFAALKAQEDEHLRAKETRDIRDKRIKDLRGLISLMGNNPSYTLAENALVAKAASKYAVLSDKTGRLKLSEIAPNNRHNVAVVSLEAADAIIRELRAGKGLKQAFLEGLQKNADQAAKDNQRKDGWQKFDQALSPKGREPINEVLAPRPARKDGTRQEPIRLLKVTKNQDELVNQENKRRAKTGEPLLEIKGDITPTIDFLEAHYKQMEAMGVEDAAVKLNKGAAGTPWCTGASESTARSQIENGDFYIYYKQGRPEVAVRMDGKDRVGEVRGNNPNQALNIEQQKIAEDFLRGSSFDGADKYLQQFANKQRAIELAKGNGSFTPKELLNNNVVESGDIRRRAVQKLLNFGVVDGYSLRPDPSQKVEEFFENKLREAVTKAYEDGYYVGNEITFSLEYGQTPESTIGTISFDGKEYTPSLENLKGAKEITVHNAANFEAPNLEMVEKIAVFGGRRGVPLDVSFPKLKNLEKITTFNDKPDQAIITLAPGAVVGEIRSADKIGYLTLNNVVEVKAVEALGFSKNQIVLTLPDALYVPEPSYSYGAVRDLRKQMVNPLVELYRDKLDLADLSEFKGDYAWDNANPEDIARAESITNKFIEDHLAAVKRELTDEQYVRYDDNQDLNDAIERGGSDSVEDVLEASVDALAEIAGNKEALKIFSKATGIPVDIPNDTKIIAPNKIADRPPTATLTETPETPRYAPKNVGVQTDEKGNSLFKSYTQPVRFGKSILATEPSIKDKLMGNFLGLAGRVQLVDQHAALSEAFKQGMQKGQISSHEGQNAEYALRFGQKRSQFAGQFLTAGRVELVENQTKNGIEYVYKAKPGVNMTDVAKSFAEAKVGNDSETEAMATLYLAGKRANSPNVGWEKLNFSEPEKVKAEYNEMMAYLKTKPEAIKAFEKGAQQYQEYNAGLLDFLVQTGALSAKKAAELKAINYIPFYRVNKNGIVELMVDKERAVRIANIKDEPQLKELVGGNKQILPLFTSAVQNTFMLTNMGLRNQSVKESAFMLRKIGIASRVAPGAGPADASTVRFRVKGEEHYAVIDKDLYGIPADLIVKGMEGIKTTIPMAVKMMGMPTNVLRQFITRNPTYAIRQAIKDPLSAWLTVGTDATPILSSMKELGKMVAGRSDVERTLMESGAISSNVFTGDQRDMSKFLKDISAGKSGWEKAMAKLDAIAMQGDASTRAVIYKDSLAKGMTEQAALLRTIESMNFERKGLSPSMHMMSTVIPFFNAQIQSMDVLYRAFKGDMPYSEQLKIKQKLLARGTMLALGSMAYAAMMQDDEAYKRAKPEERYSNWFVYVPGVSEPLRIPIPYELGYLFKALPEAVIGAANGNTETSQAVKGMATLIGQSNPFSLPQAVKPLTEAVLGKSFFGGDIESMRERQTLLPAERYRDNTSEVAKLLGSITANKAIKETTGYEGVSPLMIDHLIRGYTGPLGIAITQLANPILSSEAKSMVEQPTMKPSQMPFFGGLFQTAEGRGTLDEAYDRMHQIQEAKGTFDKMIQEGRRSEAQEFAQRYANDLALATTSASASKRLGEIAKFERMIKASPTMSTAEKDLRLKQLDKVKTDFANTLLTASDRTRLR